MAHPKVFPDDILIATAVFFSHPDNKIFGANMGPTWVLSAPDGPHVGPINLAVRAVPSGSGLISTLVQTQGLYHSDNTSFVFGAKPFPTNQNIIYECYHCAFQTFHIFAVVYMPKRNYDQVTRHINGSKGIAKLLAHAGILEYISSNQRNKICFILYVCTFLYITAQH